MTKIKRYLVAGAAVSAGILLYANAVSTAEPGDLTDGIRVGDSVDSTGSAGDWYDTAGRPTDAMPDLLPVCDPNVDCSRVWGFVRANEFHAPPDAAPTGQDDTHPSSVRVEPIVLDLLDEKGEVIGRFIGGPDGQRIEVFGAG